MAHEKPYDASGEVTAIDGQVLLDGPDGVAVSLTPDAALEMSERLLHEGLKAKGQQLAASRKIPRPRL